MKRTYDDFDEFSDAITGLSGRLLPTARSRTQWWMSHVRVAEITVHHLQIGARMSFAGHAATDSLFMALPLNDPPGIFVNGQPLGDRSVCVLHPGQSVVLAARPATQCIGIVMPTSESDINVTLSQRRAVFSAAHALCEPRALARLRALARQVSGVGRRRISADSMNQMRPEIVEAVRSTLEFCEPLGASRLGRPQYPRTQIIARCLSLVESNDNQPLYITDLCDVAGISERTLRNVFREYFGIGPKRFLSVRKLGEIRAALLRVRSEEQTVRQVLRHFGVEDFSLIARHYRSLFGESPSSTLRRAAPHRAHCVSRSWANYVSRVFAELSQ